MILYHTTDKKSAKEILRSGKFNTKTVCAWGQIDLAKDWSSYHDNKDWIVIIEKENANWSGLYYWFNSEEKYVIKGLLNISKNALHIA